MCHPSGSYFDLCLLWQETLWAKTLSDIATSINIVAGGGQDELNVQLGLPTCDDTILRWRKRLESTTMDLPQNFPMRASQLTIDATKIKAQRQKVWLVSFEMPENGEEDMTMCLMAALLNNFGAFPPMPTYVSTPRTAMRAF